MGMEELGTAGAISPRLHETMTPAERGTLERSLRNALLVAGADPESVTLHPPRLIEAYTADDGTEMPAHWQYAATGSKPT